MPKYEVQIVYNGCDIYVVEAKTPRQAEALCWGKGLQVTRSENDEYEIQSVKQIAKFSKPHKHSQKRCK